MPTHRQLDARKLKVSITIKYKSRLRALQDDIEKKEVECTRVDAKNRKVKYHCEFSNSKNIENIEVNENEFKFIGQKVDIKAWSPMALKQKKNLLEFGKEDTFKKKLYILETSEKNQDEKSFNIVGKINDNTFTHENLVLTLASLDKKTEKKVNCKIEKNNGKFKINCQPNEDVEGDLNGAIGDMDNENLIINFKNGVDSSIHFTFVKQEEKRRQENAESSSSKEQKKETNDEKNDEEKETAKEEKIFGLVSLKALSYIALGINIVLIAIIVFINICCQQQEYNSNRMDGSMDSIMNSNSQMEIK